MDAYRIASEPFYRATGGEIELFAAAFAARLPVMLKGPTGCGKTRFVEHMAWKLGRPLITVAAHEDMTAADLAGRFLLAPEGTVWHDGPLTQAVRHGAICYLDEIVEARQDTTVVIHPLSDARRVLPLDKRNELVAAHADFQLTISYNPGYQSAVKDLKESTKQRFVAIIPTTTRSSPRPARCSALSLSSRMRACRAASARSSATTSGRCESSSMPRGTSSSRPIATTISGSGCCRPRRGDISSSKDTVGVAVVNYTMPQSRPKLGAP